MEKQTTLQRLIRFSSSVFYIGYLPLFGGTAVSLLACIFYFYSNFYVYLFVLIFSLIFGFFICGRAEREFRKKDAKQIVIDDFVGQLISLFLIPKKFSLILSSFILFRLFDALKIPPINKIEELNSSKGVMGDDILAGLYANIFLHILLKLISYKGV